MIVTTTFELAGYRIREHKGLVRGTTVPSQHAWMSSSRRDRLTRGAVTARDARRDLGLLERANRDVDELFEIATVAAHVPAGPSN